MTPWERIVLYLCLTILVITLLLVLMFRYQYYQQGMVRVDRLTGRVQQWQGEQGGWYPP